MALSDPVGGTLLLSFKLLLLIPMVRVLLGGFRLALTTLVSLAPRPTHLGVLGHPGDVVGRRAPPMTKPTGSAWMLVVGAVAVLVWTVVAYVVLELVVRHSSIADRWLAEHVPDAVDAFGVSVSTGWLPLALDVVAAWVVVAMAVAIADEFGDVDVLVRRHTPASAAAAAGLVLWLFLLSVLASTAVALTLLHLGLAETTTVLRGPEEIEATLR